MKFNKNHANILKEAIQNWNHSGLLDQETTQRLQQDIEVVSFDWMRLAKYSFWIALICILTSVGSVLADKALIELLESLFNAPYIVKFFVLSVVAGFIYYFGINRRKKYPYKNFSNEAILFLGVLTTAAAIYQLGRAFDTGSGHFSVLLLLSFLIYAVLGFLFKSNLIWLFALLSFGGWVGAETGYASGWGAYYLGMNYPLRFVFIGLALIVSSLSLQKNTLFQFFLRSTLAVGLLYFFIALWIMSIFGNYGDMKSWSEVRQIELFHWAFLFGLSALAAIYHGLKFDNGMTKGFGITFLFINLYTRFFEYFWDSIHKAILFAVLGLSFWYLGSHAEKIWYLGKSNNKS